MAKKGRRKFRRYLGGQVDLPIPISALGAQAVVSAVVTDTLSEKAWLSSVMAAWTLLKYTKATNDGPIMCGVAHSDYTDAEIEAWIENQGSWQQGDKISQEIARRKIRRVGVFGVPVDVDEVSRLQDGKQIRTKCGWQLTTGQTLRCWAYNMGTSALQTSSPVVEVQGKANLWPN